MARSSRRRPARPAARPAPTSPPAPAAALLPPPAPRPAAGWAARPSSYGELVRAVREAHLAQERVRAAVSRFRLDRATWGDVAAVLGVSRHVARARFGA